MTWRKGTKSKEISLIGRYLYSKPWLMYCCWKKQPSYPWIIEKLSVCKVTRQNPVSYDNSLGTHSEPPLEYLQATQEHVYKFSYDRVDITFLEWKALKWIKQTLQRGHFTEESGRDCLAASTLVHCTMQV